MTEALKACPCCQSDASMIPFATERSILFIVQCDHCGLKTGKHTSEAKAIAAWNTRTSERDWQGIESAPRDGTWFLGFWPVSTFEDQQTPTRWVESGLKDGPYWQDAADHIDWTQPTHWQPLPAPPERGDYRKD